MQAGESYRVDRGWESPDGAWIAAIDSADRVLLFATHGTADPRVWVPRADGVPTLLWEGELVDNGVG